MKNLIEHARNVIGRARGENDNLNVVIAALVGALYAKTQEDTLDISAEEIFTNNDPNDLFDGKIQTIVYNEDSELRYTDDKEEEDGDLDGLPISTRLELAEKLAELLES